MPYYGVTGNMAATHPTVTTTADHASGTGAACYWAPGLGCDGASKITDDEPLSFRLSQCLGAAGENMVISHEGAGLQTVGNDMKDGEPQGLGAFGPSEIKDHVKFSSGMGPGEMHSWGAVCSDISPGSRPFRHRFDQPSKR